MTFFLAAASVVAVAGLFLTNSFTAPAPPDHVVVSTRSGLDTNLA